MSPSFCPQKDKRKRPVLQLAVQNYIMVRDCRLFGPLTERKGPKKKLFNESVFYSVVSALCTMLHVAYGSPSRKPPCCPRTNALCQEDKPREVSFKKVNKCLKKIESALFDQCRVIKWKLAQLPRQCIWHNTVTICVRLDMIQPCMQNIMFFDGLVL